MLLVTSWIFSKTTISSLLTSTSNILSPIPRRSINVSRICLPGACAPVSIRDNDAVVQIPKLRCSCVYPLRSLVSLIYLRSSNLTSFYLPVCTLSNLFYAYTEYTFSIPHSYPTIISSRQPPVIFFLKKQKTY